MKHKSTCIACLILIICFQVSKAQQNAPIEIKRFASSEPNAFDASGNEARTFFDLKFREGDSRWQFVGRYGKGIKPYIKDVPAAMKAFHAFRVQRYIKEAGISLAGIGFIYYAAQLVKTDGEPTARANKIGGSLMGFGLATFFITSISSKMNLKKAVKRYNNSLGYHQPIGNEATNGWSFMEHVEIAPMAGGLCARLHF